MLRKQLLAVIAAFTLATPALAVTWGKPDTTEAYPLVGTLLFLREDGFYSCSGTLLAPDVMVTAGHCVESEGKLNLGTWVSFEPEISFANVANYPSAIDYLNAEWIQTKFVVAHPDYDDFQAFPNTYDVGIVKLAEPVVLGTYAQLPTLGLLDVLAGSSQRLRQFTVVGYGRQGVLPPFDSDIYARYVGSVMLLEVKSTRVGVSQSAKFTNNPGRGGGSCFGDSGGPIFRAGTTTIVAVVSFGYTPCIGVDYQYRLDTEAAQDFIRQYL